MKISVAMCTHNGARYLAEQINSIMYQTRCVDELVIVDDCSSDETCKIIEEFRTKCNFKIKLLMNENNIGVSKSFDKCIMECAGDIIFTADQDDIWEENKVQIMSEIFEKNSNCVLASSDATVVDSELNTIVDSAWDALCLDRCGIEYDNVSQQKLLNTIAYQPVVFGNMMALRGDFARQIFPMNQVEGYIHDNWAAMCAPIFGEIVLVNEKLIKYRRHDKNVSSSITYDTSDSGKTSYHMQRFLLYIRENQEKLQNFVNSIEKRGIEIPQWYMEHIQGYIKRFSGMSTYRNISSVKKISYLVKLLFDQEVYDMFHISRKDICIYLCIQLQRKC